MTSFFTGVSGILSAVSVLRDMVLINTAVRTGDVESDTSDRDNFCIHRHISYKTAGCLSPGFPKYMSQCRGSEIDLGVIFWSHSY